MYGFSTDAQLQANVNTSICTLHDVMEILLVAFVVAFADWVEDVANYNDSKKSKDFFTYSSSMSHY
jgi:hypothetical protein